jgi:hypothetical protein
MTISEWRRVPRFVSRAALIGILLAGVTACSQVCQAQDQPEHSSPSLPAKPYSRTAPRAVEAPHNAADACALLSDGVIRKLQSESVKDKKRTQTTNGPLMVSQCFYSLPTFANSISVTLALPAAAGSSPSATRGLWDSLFHPAADSEEQGERGKEIAPEEREEHTPPVEVHELGDEAYWIPTLSGALYVLKGNAFLRISVGGKLSDAQRLNKSKQLAQDALQRLP